VKEDRASKESARGAPQDDLSTHHERLEESKESAQGAPQDDLSTHHERLEWVKTSIALEDLFKSRSIKPDEPERDVQKVLLVGEAGTGKTTLSRKVASSWAQGKWGEAFEAVYVLPVRSLPQSQYDNLSMRREETLATAIANHCFPPREEEEYKRLRRHISEELEQPTTLLVLDGLDERYGASDKLLGQALGGSHKLLLLSRPYGIEQERSLVDLEIEHVGLSDGQMENYVSGELSLELGEGLLSFIREHPAIAAIAHVPVNLHILCALWQDDVGGVRAEIMRGSLPGLYRKLTGYIWERYEKRHRELGLQNKEREELFDMLGKIALRALERGELLISSKLVDAVLEEVPNSDDRRLFSEILPASGLLQVVGRQYQFPHLTFQEYFAGRLLARNLLSEDGKAQSRVGKFFSKHKYERQYGVMFSFLSGEVSKFGGLEGIGQLLSLLEVEPKEVVGVQHLLLQLRCVNEWLCVAGEDLEGGLGELEEKFHVIRSLKKWFGIGLKRVRRGEYDRKLLKLLTTGLQGLRAVAAHAPALLELLREAMRDRDYNVRSAASSALGEVVKAAPDHAEKVLPSLIEAMRDDHWRVRSAASSALGEVVKAAPDHAEKVLPSLIEAMRDSEDWVRSAASSALG
ncbi:MAG: HEAT repeat domain-containing protein, partial [Cytophagales bacterium]|nr:HEAT repeat domain-containing protein [Cytophagales bacterium]